HQFITPEHSKMYNALLHLPLSIRFVREKADHVLFLLHKKGREGGGEGGRRRQTRVRLMGVRFVMVRFEGGREEGKKKNGGQEGRTKSFTDVSFTKSSFASPCPSSRAEKDGMTNEKEATSSSLPSSSSHLLSLLRTASDLESISSLHSSFLSSLAQRAFLSDGDGIGGGGREGGREGGQGETCLVRNQVRYLVRLALRCVVEEEKEGGIEGEEAHTQTGAGKAYGETEGGEEERSLVYKEFEDGVIKLLGLLMRMSKNYTYAPWVEALRVRLDYNGFFSASALRYEGERREG
ncbi:hypothetical protein VYU27_010491, partial [Nannochloropsis oceanica]